MTFCTSNIDHSPGNIDWRFFSRLAHRQNTFDENGLRKRIFSKTLSKVEILKKGWTFVYLWTDENGGFEYHDVMHASCTIRITHAPWGLLPYFHRCVDRRERFALLLRVDAYYFFANEEKKLRFQKYPDTSGRGLKYGVYKMKFNIYLSKQNDLSNAEVDILLLGSLITDNNIFNIPSVKHTQKKFELNLAEFFSLEFLG